MPKLSALTAGNIVKIPIFGITRELTFLQYNHYSKSEATLLGPSFLLPENALNTWHVGGSGGGLIIADMDYPNSHANYFCTSTLKAALPDSIRASLVENNFSATSTTITTSIIIPTAAEIGQGSVTASVVSVGRTLGISKYSDGGTAFSYLSSSSADINFRDYVSIEIREYNHIPAMTVSGSNGKRATDFQVRDSASDAESEILAALFHTATLGATGSSTRYVTGRTSVQPIFLLNGNVEVTGSSTNYTISKTTAIETYRKIDGVWYRTI